MRLSRAIDDRKTAGALILLLLLGIFILGIGLAGIWYYTTESYMVMAGKSEMTIGLNGYFKDPGVEAKISGRDITDKVKVKTDLDVSKPGEYKINYNAGNFEAVRKVKVLDHMSPELELSGGDVRIPLGEKYEEPGFKARDDEGNDLTGKVKVSKIDDRRAGKKTI